jgi:dihydrodipicolinate synthase/N-acetylneuraminate lyase
MNGFLDGDGALDVVAVAATAWFDGECKLHPDAFATHCDWLIGEDCGAVVVIGSGSECEVLTADKRDAQTRAATVAVDRNWPRIFKSSGMVYEDLVIASEMFRAICLRYFTRKGCIPCCTSLS